MTPNQPTPDNPLEELLLWLDEVDRADSYAGFTFNDWLNRRPEDAIQALRDLRKDAS